MPRLGILLLLSLLIALVIVSGQVRVGHANLPDPTLMLSATSGPVGSSITITGLGFAGSTTIQITSLVGTLPVSWLIQGTCLTIGGGLGTADSLVISGCLSTTAGGNFEVAVPVPEMPGGPQTITISDGTSITTATFTVTPSLTLRNSDFDSTDTLASGYPEQVTTVEALVHGFAASEAVIVSSTGVFSSFSPTLTTDAFGYATSTVSAIVADSSGGSKSIVATGETSSLTATTTFKILPWVSFYNSQNGSATFSFLGKSPTSLLIEGHGFAGTIAANSITIGGGIATTHSAVAVGIDGKFGAGVGTHLVVSPNTDVPFGQASVVIQGTTFSLATGNINQWNGGGSAGPVLGGVLISSFVGGASSTAVGQLDKSGYGYGDAPNAIGYGFKPGDTITPNANGALVGVTLGIASNTIENDVVNANGAIFVKTIAGSFGDVAAGSYTDSFTGSTTSNTTLPSFTIHPVLLLSFSGTSINYKSPGLSLSAHGFFSSTSMSVTADGATLALGTSNALGTLSVSVITPDLAMGTWTATASDGTSTATDTFSVSPLVDFGGGTALTVNTGPAGTVSVLQTGPNSGVHGLKASTTYNVNWGIVSGGVRTLTTFTTTPTGGISPGAQLTMPFDTPGYQIVSLVQSGTNTDALFGAVLADTPSSLGPAGQFGDLIIRLLPASAHASPSGGSVGTIITLSGNGFAFSTTYYSSVSRTSGGGGAQGQLFSALTTDSAGNIPAGSSFEFPNFPALPGPGPGTCSDGTAYPEEATGYYIHLSQASEFPGSQDGQAFFTLSGNAVTNSSSVAAGHSLTLTVTGLCASQVYNVIFNYVSNGVTFTGQTVAAFVTNTVGSGSDVFTVPASTAPGPYVVQLQRSGPTTELGVLSLPPTVTVTAGRISGSIRIRVTESGAPTATFGLSGCGVSITSVAGDGQAHSFNAAARCTITVAAPAAGSSSRYLFARATASLNFTSCTNGVCGEQDYTYYYQLSQPTSISVAGGGSPDVSLNSSQFGAPTLTRLTSATATFWIDYGTSASVPATTAGGTGEQWITTTSSWSVTSSNLITNPIAYRHQYFLTATVSPSGAGTTTPSSGWINAGGTVMVTAIPNSGFVFQTWSCSGTGCFAGSSNPTPSIAMNDAISETANFGTHTTSASVSCSPNPVPVNTSTRCTATIIDTSSGATVPRGSVAFSKSSLLPSLTCDLSERDASSSSCFVTYTPGLGSEGTYVITASYSGVSGHSTSNFTFSIFATQRPTSASVVCSPSSAAVDDMATCTATVLDADSDTPITAASKVAFADSPTSGIFSQTSCTLEGGSCSVTYTPSPGKEGPITIRGDYGGDTDHSISSGTFPLNATVRSTSASVDCIISSVVVNDQSTCTATVKDMSTGTTIAPAGTVSFYVGSKNTGSCNLDESKGTCSVSFVLGSDYVGSNLMTVGYAGDKDHAQSTSALFVLTIELRPVVVRGSCAPSLVYINQNTTCSATVSDNGPPGSSSEPQGTVNFRFDGPTDPSWSCTLTSGQCSVAITPGPGTNGSRTAIAYDGSDGVHAKGLVSANLTIDLLPTTTRIVCAPSRPIVDQQSICTATVSGNVPAGSALTPSGTVTFTADGTNIGTCTISSGSCSVKYTPRSDSVGSQMLTASYNDISGVSRSSTDSIALSISSPLIGFLTSISGIASLGAVAVGLPLSLAKVLPKLSEEDSNPIAVEVRQWLLVMSEPVTGVRLRLDGRKRRKFYHIFRNAYTSPLVTDVSVGSHTISVPPTVLIDGKMYHFVRWSDGSTHPNKQFQMVGPPPTNLTDLIKSIGDLTELPDILRGNKRVLMGHSLTASYTADRPQAENMHEPSYCTKCGNELKVDDAFCGNCGSPAHQPA